MLFLRKFTLESILGPGVLLWTQIYDLLHWRSNCFWEFLVHRAAHLTGVVIVINHANIVLLLCRLELILIIVLIIVFVLLDCLLESI